MGMDLHGKHGDEFFNIDDWPVCLQIARRFGWNPEGTTDPLLLEAHECYPGSVSAWDGNYHYNEGQRVSDRDARALGEALLRAADAITGNEVWLDDIEFQSEVMKRFCELTASVVSPPRPTLNDLVATLRRLADYAIIGGFRIL
jgi:hypothetical protein